MTGFCITCKAKELREKLKDETLYFQLSASVAFNKEIEVHRRIDELIRRRTKVFKIKEISDERI